MSGLSLTESFMLDKLFPLPTLRDGKNSKGRLHEGRQRRRIHDVGTGWGEVVGSDVFLTFQAVSVFITPSLDRVSMRVSCSMLLGRYEGGSYLQAVKHLMVSSFKMSFFDFLD